MGIPRQHTATAQRGAHTILITAFILFFTAGCQAPQGNKARPDAPVVKNNSPVQESWNFRFTVTEAGTRKSLITAGHAAEFRIEGGSEQHLDEGVAVDFFDADGNTTTHISADRAIVYENQDIEGMGNVVISSKDSTIIRTAYAKRSGVDHKIRSDRFVTIKRPGQSISGYGFESDQELKHYRIFRGSGEGLINK